MYGIFTYIYHNQPNDTIHVGKYAWMVWVLMHIGILYHLFRHPRIVRSKNQTPFARDFFPMKSDLRNKEWYRPFLALQGFSCTVCDLSGGDFFQKVSGLVGWW